MAVDEKYGRVVLLSGGVDSAFLAFRLGNRSSKSLGLFVDYGQPAAGQEEKSARIIAQAAQLDFKKVTTSGMPLGGMSEENDGPCVVPSRNLYLVALASAWAEEVFIGATPQDRQAYPDCRDEFFDALNVAMESVDSVVRYSDATRQERVEWLEDMGFLKFTWSCYFPSDDGPCGQCASCSQ